MDLLYVGGRPPNIIRVIISMSKRQVGHVASMGELNAYSILIGRPEEKRPLSKPRLR
jgi:hypothetical protein